ncbi:MAG: tripartite tricarboxylate transporter substrate binding protein [Burkholderiales bacterium]|nr:tripartite tricarboxylate transporter substrate binding protein [Burkholderiales bacterium]
MIGTRALQSGGAHALFLVLALSSGNVVSQPYPSKPIRMIVPFPAGGGSDSTARILGQRLSERVKQQIVVDNRVGAAGTIGTEIASRAAPNGYTLLLGSASEIVMLPAVATKLAFDPLKDFVPIARVADVPLVLVVNPALPVTTTQELIALARKRPGEINFGSTGIGSMTHLAMAMFNLLSATKMVHIPYKGIPQNDLVAGVLQAGTHTMPGSIGLIKAGRLRVLAVTTPRRAALLPEIPTVAEAGVPGYEVTLWTGVFAPTGTAREVVSVLEREIEQSVRSQEMHDALMRLGSEPNFSGAAQFSAFMKTDHERWVKVARETGIRLEQF